MLSPRLKPGVFVVLLAATVAATITLVTTLREHSLSGAFVDLWARSFLIGLAVAVPTGLLAAGPLRRFSEWLCR